MDTTVALGTRAGACHRGTCPVGIATQTAELRMRLDPQISARRLHTFLTAGTVMISDYCRITGRRRVGDLGFSDLATTFFTTDHYAGHPVVLVRMNAVDADELTELISDSWALRAPRSLTKRWALERDRDLP